MKEMIANNITIVDDKYLAFAGQDVTLLAEEYGTPAYLMDEERIRSNCRMYKNAFEKHFGITSYPLYASKACSFKALYRIMKEEKMGIDVVSSGEIYTAVQAGFDMSKAYYHSNNKTDEDIEFAVASGVGHFVIDNKEELEAIDEIASKFNTVQNVLIRISPGIDSHTYEAVSTGKVDSKFGVAIATGQADELIGQTVAKKNVKLKGLHCHIGSQVFAEDVFERAAVVMLNFFNEMQIKHNVEFDELNLGGGYGVRYVDTDPYLDVEKKVGEIAVVVKKTCGELGIKVPEIHMEPGRSIVADAGMTIYNVGTVKEIPGYLTYVSVNGGMTDNPRYALYESNYTIHIANKMDEICDKKVVVAGRCCESGDLLQRDVLVPSSVKRDDILAVCTTGAYNYSMSSNYNRVGKPPVIMLKSNGGNYIAVKRETLDDIIRNDV